MRGYGFTVPQRDFGWKPGQRSSKFQKVVLLEPYKKLKILGKLNRTPQARFLRARGAGNRSTQQPQRIS
jgi:hypothetical protein